MNQPVTWGPPRAERADAARNRRLLLVTAREIIAGQADAWTEEWFNGHGLHKLRGTVRYPRAA